MDNSSVYAILKLMRFPLFASFDGKGGSSPRCAFSTRIK